MNASGSESDDKVVVDPPDHEQAGKRGSPSAVGRGEQPRNIAKGTREQVVVVCPLAAATTPAPGHYDLERDPVQVLRTWPHSKVGPDTHLGASRGSIAPGSRRIDDKIALAHLALDLYREIDQLETGALRAHPPHHGDAACTNQGCLATTSALRGALVEACLLVQRVAMMPAVMVDIEDRIRELLDVLER